jgi:hypothetical protein
LRFGSSREGRPSPSERHQRFAHSLRSAQERVVLKIPQVQNRAM